MATRIHYPSESSTIDALWTILSQQTESVKRALITRLSESLADKRVIHRKSLEVAPTFVDSLSVKGSHPVPANENGIDALINEKYV